MQWKFSWKSNRKSLSVYEKQHICFHTIYCSAIVKLLQYEMVSHLNEGVCSFAHLPPNGLQTVFKN